MAVTLLKVAGMGDVVAAGGRRCGCLVSPRRSGRGGRSGDGQEGQSRPGPRMVAGNQNG